MKTEKLYLNHTEQKEFEAEVIKSFKQDDLFAVVLDRTAFYPTSGGQMHDTGSLNDVEVIDVIEGNDHIIHLLTKPIDEGAKVIGKINWERRFDFMQQHTGFHILAQSFLKVLDKETLSSHLGEKISTIDVNIEKINLSQIKSVENLANQICFEDRSVKQFFTSVEELNKYHLRAMPAKTGLIRLVEIEDFDVDPCAGTHVGSTGQVGLIKIIRWEKIRGNLRFEFYAGKRALQDYQKKWSVLQNLSTALTESEENLLHSIEKLKTEYKNLMKEKSKISKKILDFEIKELLAEAANQKIIIKIFENRELHEIRFLANQLIKQTDIWLLFGLKSEKAHLILAHSNHYQYNLNQLVQQIAPLIDGRGGGRADFVEIGGKNILAIKTALNQAKEFIEANNLLKNS